MANPLLLGAGLVGAGLLWLKMRKGAGFTPQVTVEQVAPPRMPDALLRQGYKGPRPGATVQVPDGVSTDDRMTLEQMVAAGASTATAKARRAEAAVKEAAAQKAQQVFVLADQRVATAVQSIFGLVQEASASFVRLQQGLAPALQGARSWVVHFREAVSATVALSGQFGPNALNLTLEDLQSHRAQAAEARAPLAELLSLVEPGRSARMQRYGATLSELLRQAKEQARVADSAYREYTGLMAEAFDLYGNPARAQTFRSNRGPEDAGFPRMLRAAEALNNAYNNAEMAHWRTMLEMPLFNTAVTSLENELLGVRGMAKIRETPSETYNRLRRLLQATAYDGVKRNISRMEAQIPALSVAVTALSARLAAGTEAAGGGLAGLGKVSKSMANMRVTVSGHGGHFNAGETRGMERSPIDPDENNVRVGMGSDLADWYGPALIPVGAQNIPQNVGYYGDSGYAKPAFSRALRGVHSLGEPIMVLETLLAGGLAGLGAASGPECICRWGDNAAARCPARGTPGHAGCQCHGGGNNCLCK